MKVLWVVNTIFPDLSSALGASTTAVGGWMYGLADDLKDNSVDLYVATSRENCEDSEKNINGVTYILVKGKNRLTEYDSTLEAKWEAIIIKLNPDVVHIHGTEYAHGLSLLKACPELNYVISIQGLISVYSRYYYGGISANQIKKHKTLRDYLKKDGILRSKMKFYRRGESIEKQYFKLAVNFIGRTQWDYSHVKTLNKNAEYFFCNESLRDSFYSSKKWNIESKQDHTIFLSQGLYPLKGIHQVIRAIAFIKDDFPKVKIRVAGSNIVKTDTFKERITLGGYGNFLLHLIRKYDLQNSIEFIGYLDEKQMIQEYLSCHVFICPSSIENSPNSLGEAQILGTPCIASYVGGIPDMVANSKTGLLYRFEEVEMLAQMIRKIFTEDNLTKKLSANAIKVAEKRHNRETNLNKTLEIYKKIIKNKY